MPVVLRGPLGSACAAAQGTALAHVAVGAQANTQPVLAAAALVHTCVRASGGLRVMKLWPKELWRIELWHIELWRIELWHIDLWRIELWHFRFMAYRVMAYRVMAYRLMAYRVMVWTTAMVHACARASNECLRPCVWGHASHLCHMCGGAQMVSSARPRREFAIAILAITT